MTTAIALGLMLAFEPKEAGIMTFATARPRPPLLTGWLVRRTSYFQSCSSPARGGCLHGSSTMARACMTRTAAPNLFVVTRRSICSAAGR